MIIHSLSSNQAGSVKRASHFSCPWPQEDAVGLKVFLIVHTFDVAAH